jgi:Zn-finger nucleic acid-binding protein
MPVCPICNKELDTVPQRQGVYHVCPTCNGRALSIPQIRRVAGDHFAVRLLRLQVAGCRPCNIVWFDAQNYKLIPEWTVANNTGVSMQDIETESLRRLKELKEREKAAAEEEKRKKSLRRSLKTLWEQERDR